MGSKEIYSPPFTENLLRDYCGMINKLSTKEIVSFAIQNIEPMISGKINRLHS
jgi:hypothetical protein